MYINTENKTKKHHIVQSSFMKKWSLQVLFTPWPFQRSSARECKEHYRGARKRITHNQNGLLLHFIKKYVLEAQVNYQIYVTWTKKPCNILKQTKVFLCTSVWKFGMWRPMQMIWIHQKLWCCDYVTYTSYVHHKWPNIPCYVKGVSITNLDTSDLKIIFEISTHHENNGHTQP